MIRCTICGRTVKEIEKQDGVVSLDSNMLFICNRCKENEEKKQQFKILRKAMDYNRIKFELEYQKEMWNELKEYISNQIIHYDKLSDIFRDEKNDGCVLLSLTKKHGVERILYKMQELEGEKDVKD